MRHFFSKQTDSCQIVECWLGLFISNFIAPYRKENTSQCSLLDNVSCQNMSNLQISNSFEKLRSFWIEVAKDIFLGRKFDLKFCTFLHYPKRGHYAFQVILFHSNGLINYRKIEYFWYTLISFGITPNFRSNLRPLNINLEKNALHIWIQNDLSFSKLFEIWKSDKLWQMNDPNTMLNKSIK